MPETEIRQKYYDNGQLSYEISYQNGRRHGVFKIWHKNGQLRWLLTYRNDQKHGINKGWKENGMLYWEKYFLYDKEVSEKEYRKYELIEELAGL